jgi:hypothetical protein
MNDGYTTSQKNRKNRKNLVLQEFSPIEFFGFFRFFPLDESVGGRGHDRIASRVPYRGC